ncbi:hypothetical protein [Halorhabdus salina]|uniref:hypothetical protein n=1 Tax=Halorhabdus salina TaxID=2750670 RepID=UPI0015EF32EE|nr:hypothetical protein [Halorhabdus salina]
MAAGVIVVLVLVIGVAFPIVLYALVRGEHDKRDTMTREEAERTARRDTRKER